MTHELECRRQDGEAPFDGLTLYCLANLEGATLARALSCAVETLQQHAGQIPLRFFDCWLEHDGILCDTEPTTWEHIKEEVATAASLEQAFSYWDAHVRRAYTPENQIFLLRYYLETHEPLQSFYSIYLSDFDLTGPPELISEIADQLQAQGITQIALTAPLPYFLPRGVAAWDAYFWREHLEKYRRGELGRKPGAPPELWRTGIRETKS